MIRTLLLLFCMLTLSQCTPCRWTSCGCDYDTNNGLQVIEQMSARFGTNTLWDDSTSYYNWSSAAVFFRITAYSPLAAAPIQSSWSFIRTANACDPAIGYQQATTYMTDVIVIAQKAESLQLVQWNVGDTISHYFNFGESYNLKSIPQFLANHDRIYVGDEYQLRLNTPTGGQKRMEVTVHLQMSGGRRFSFPNLIMRVN